MYRPPIGIPWRKQTRWQGWLLSLLAHLFLLVLLLRPARDSGIDYGHRDGSGGLGPSGGGGGSSRAGTVGDGGEAMLHFVQIAPQSNSPPAVVPVLPIPLPTAVPPPVPVPKIVTRDIAAPVPTLASTAAATSSPTGGAGTGTGKVAGAGAGSGTGGGVGSGEGRGNGSGVGPGAGGGVAKNHPPTLKQFVLPPLPTPSSVRGFKLTAWFDVDSTGKATLLRFTPTPDHDYNNRIRETLLALRFRPAVRVDGSALRDTVDIEVLF